MSLLVNDTRVIISQGGRPLFNRILAAGFFTGGLYCLAVFVLGLFEKKGLLAYLYIAIFCLYFGFILSYSSNFIFDFKRHRFKEEFQMGIFKFGWWEPMPPIEYVSLFNSGENEYQISIWIEGNDKYHIGGYTSAEDGIKASKIIAKKLSIDLWDATDPHNGYWVDLEK